jgi:tetratricopeptide (TPR) repeat protein
MRAATILVALTALGVPGSAAAQSSQAKQGSHAPAQQAPSYNPLRAVHDVEVGKFYLDRGDLDAAINRFKDALRYKKDYAEPCLLLGKAYDKKSDPEAALRYYQQYLKILPDSSESKKVRERIAKLRDKLKKENASAGRD